MLSQRIEDWNGYNTATRTGGNLNELERRYYAALDRLKPAQRGKLDLSSMVMAFKGSQAASYEGSDRLQLEYPLRPVGAMRMLSLVPLPSSWVDLPRRGGRAPRYWGHLVDCAATVYGNEVWVGGPDLAPPQYFQYDAFKRPLQDHQIYSNCGNSVLGTYLPGIKLVSPISGTLALVRNDLHLRVTVNGDDVFRFRLVDADAFEPCITSGDVDAGAVLGTLNRPVEYLQAKFRGSRPEMDYIGGDIMSASKKSIHIEFALLALEKIVEYAEARRQKLPVPPESAMDPRLLLPRHLVEIPTEAVDNRRAPDCDWRPNAVFCEQLRRAVSPMAYESQAGLFVRSPVSGYLLSDERRGCFRLLTFVCHEAKSVISLPACVELHVTPGETGVPVEKGQILGDYINRTYYPDYQTLVNVADELIVPIEDAYLNQQLIRSGTCNWAGSGVGDSVCLDATIAGELLMSSACGHWVDFSAMARWYVKELSIYITPAMPYVISQRHSLQHRVNGIVYDGTPHGGKFGRLQNLATVMPPAAVTV